MVFDHADDGHGEAAVVCADGVAEGIGVGQEAARELLIDDADVGGVDVVRIGELAAGEDGNAEGTEEVRPNDVAADGSGGAVGDIGQAAVDAHVTVVRPPGADALFHEGDGLDARHGAQPAEEVGIEDVTFGDGRDFWIDAEDDEAVDVHAERRVFEVAHGANEEASGDEQDNAHGELQGDDNAAGAGFSGIAVGGCGGGFEGEFSVAYEGDA